MHIDNVIFLILSKNAYTKFSAGPTFVTIAEALGVTPNDLLSDPAVESNYPRALQEKVAPLPIEKQEKIYKIVCALCDDL